MPANGRWDLIRRLKVKIPWHQLQRRLGLQTLAKRNICTRHRNRTQPPHDSEINTNTTILNFGNQPHEVESFLKKLLVLWHSKFHYRVHNSPPVIHIFLQTNPVHAFPTDLRSILTLYSHLRLGLPSRLVPSV